MQSPRKNLVDPAPKPAERSEGVAERSGAGLGAARAPIRRWTVSRKLQQVLRLLRGESLEAVSRDCGVPTWKLAKWRDKAMAGMENGLNDRPRELGIVLDEQKDALIARMAMENDLLKKKTAGKPMRWTP